MTPADVLAEIGRRYRALNALPSTDRPGSGRRQPPSPTYLALAAEIRQLATRYRQLATPDDFTFAACEPSRERRHE